MKCFKTLILLVILLAVHSSRSNAQSFRRQGIYYWINQNTKEARISNIIDSVNRTVLYQSYCAEFAECV